VGRLDGRVALITGAARGQGAQAARQFAAEGAQVMLADVLDDLGPAVAAEIGQAAAYAHLDVTDEDAWAKAAAECVARFGKLDALVNNAGIYRVAPLTEITLEDYLAITAVNEVGVFLGMRAVAPALAEAGGGTIVNVSSTAAMLPFPGATAYAASKAAVLGLTKVAAGEFGPLGIRVNSVHPGAVDTPMMAGVDTAVAGRLLPLRRIGNTGDIAAVVLFLTSGESAFCTGAAFVADGGLCAGPVFS
jgi:3alpha(or 20beta)-hydroxysteroid dehydrogenase